MKKFFFTLALTVASLTLFAQNFDVFVTHMNEYTRRYGNTEIAGLYNNYYGVPESTLNLYYSDLGECGFGP